MLSQHMNESTAYDVVSQGTDHLKFWGGGENLFEKNSLKLKIKIIIIVVNPIKLDVIHLPNIQASRQQIAF